MVLTDGNRSSGKKEAEKTPAAPSSSSSSRRLKKDKKWRWKKPKGKPKRPLSAYNLFFQEERKRFNDAGESGASYKKEEFVSLVKTIAAKWMTLGENERAPFEEMAAAEKERYRQEVAVWQSGEDAKQRAKEERERGGGSGGGGLSSRSPPSSSLSRPRVSVPKMDPHSFLTGPATTAAAPVTTRIYRQVTPDAGAMMPPFAASSNNRSIVPPTPSRNPSLLAVDEGGQEGVHSRRSSLGSVDAYTARLSAAMSYQPPRPSISSYPAAPPSSAVSPPCSSSLLMSDDESTGENNLGSFLDNFNRAILKKCSDSTMTTAAHGGDGGGIDAAPAVVACQLDDFNKALLKKCSADTATATAARGGNDAAPAAVEACQVQVVIQTEPGRPRRVALSSTGAHNMLATTQAELDDDCKELMLEIFG